MLGINFFQHLNVKKTPIKIVGIVYNTYATKYKC